MEIISSYLPSSGIGYNFPSIKLNPMTFLQMTRYMEDTKDLSQIEKYFYDIRMLVDEDHNILNCYIMDLDFLIYYKKLISVSGNTTLNISVQCPSCGTVIQREVDFEKDIKFEAVDEKIMNGAQIILNKRKYEIRVPTVQNLLKVFDIFKRYSRVNDLKMMKTLALFEDFDTNSQQIEKDVLGATREDITILLALQELYFDRVEPIKAMCPKCDKERRGMTISVNSLVVDFFQSLALNSKFDGTKIVFK
jgi:endogenous inhibitor of DNA gyrase (YacG/DUF329 family)